MPQTNRYEQQFLDALKDIFIGAKVEGDSGYINLMKIKARYFEHGVFPHLMKDIDAACKPFEKSFREELFDKLYDFFKRYFSESGSIYFRNTALHQNIYERVYTDDRDVMLFWKTHMLYYVKTDRLFNSMEVEVDGTLLYFDVSMLEHKRANEKRELMYAFKEYRKKEGKIVLAVSYSERGRKTKSDDILRALKEKGIMLDEATLERACRIFEKQSEVDYFINKNAKAFLKEQFDLWLYQYVFGGESNFTEARLKQLQAIKDIAYHIIDFIAQFEDELVRVWNKPKFVLNSHYVISLDKITDPKLLIRIFDHPGMTAQLQEWQNLGMVDTKFKPETVFEKDLLGAPLNPRYQFLPLDTRHFPDLELDILALFDDLDAALDGWLVHSENYQALNTLLPKFRERIQIIYIDPPFNTGDDFAYIDNFQDSTWLSIMNDRTHFAKQFLTEKGSLFCHLDANANYYGRLILENYFSGQFMNEIIWHYPDNFQGNVKGFANNHDIILWYAKQKAYISTERVMIDLDKPTKRDKRIWSKDDQKLVAARDEKGKIIYSTFTDKKADDVWTIGQSSTTKSQSREFIDFDTQKPEEILRRVITASSKQDDKCLVLDFYLGTGTTIAVAQKMKKKWIGIEMGAHFGEIILPRIKRVLSGYVSGVSEKVGWIGGGFLKYYELEQYEDSLRRAHYEDAPLLKSVDAYNSYVFLRDLKMLDAVSLDKPNNRVNVDLEKLYDGIDLAETLSCVTGKGIKRITKESVEFQDGTTASLIEPDWTLIKPLVWW